MRRPFSLLLIGSILLAGCGGWRDSRLNPGNWFGSSEPVVVETAAEGTEDYINPLIPTENRSKIFSRPEAVDESVLINTVSEMRIERTATGAIIYATGVADRQGAFDVELRPTEVEEDSATLTFDFRVVYPEDPTSIGTEFSRTVRAAYSLTVQDMRGISTIRVQGATNARESRR